MTMNPRSVSDSDSEWHSISSDEIRDSATELAEDELGLNPNDVNVAVCGSVKSGKTRLIKALGGCISAATDLYVHASPSSTASGSQTTAQPFVSKTYGCVFWKIPGFGQLGVKTDFNSSKLAGFDFLLICTGETLREEEIDVGIAAKKRELHTAFIRSRCDRDLRQNAADADEGTEWDKIKSDFLNHGHEKYQEEWKKQKQKFPITIFFLSAPCIEKDNEHLKLDEDKFLQYLKKMIASSKDAKQRRMFRRNLGMKKDELNFAICGAPESGKTEFLKKLSGLFPGPQTISYSYFHSSTPVGYKTVLEICSEQVAFWDLDRCSTDADSYFREQKLIAFNCLLLFVNERIRSEDILIAQLAQHHGLPFCFVRSKCDDLFSNGMTYSDARRAFDEQLTSNFPDFFHSSELFFISSKQRTNNTDEENDELVLNEENLYKYIKTKVNGSGCDYKT